MNRFRYNRIEAARHLCEQCPSLAEVIQHFGPMKFKLDQDPDLFSAIASSIVYQQLSGKAAATIHGRFCTLFDNQRPDAAGVERISISQLRSVGLSQNKALAIQDLARKTLDGTLLPISRINRLNDEEVIENLVQVRGIGPWTAQMLLIFTLGRPDVMPATDLGIQKGVQVTYRMRKLPDPAQVLKRTRHLAPYRSLASWYFWRIADG